MINRSYILGHIGHPHYITDFKVLSLQTKTYFSKEEEELVKIVRNLSDPTKLKIYLLLHKVKEISVTDLTRILGLTQSAVSHSLSDLKSLGMVKSHRCGQRICYSLSNSRRKNKFLSFFNFFKNV